MPRHGGRNLPACRPPGCDGEHNGGEQINWNNHVERQGRAARGGGLKLEGADAQQLAFRADQGRAAPVWMTGRGEDCFLQKVLPVAGKLLPGSRFRPVVPQPPSRTAEALCVPVSRIKPLFDFG